jgi:hypothetical protein
VRYLFALSALWLPAAGCSEDDGDEVRGNPADCVLIANRCHKYDTGSGLPHDCHEVGHEGASPVQCTKMRTSCLAACPETDGGSGGTGGSGGASGAAGTAGADGSGGSAGADASGGSAGATDGSAGQPSSGGAGGGAHDGGSSACDQLANVCHGIGTPVADQCHELGHDGNEPACEAELAECLAVCVDAGP